MELTLVLQTGDDAGRRYPVPPGPAVTVGRVTPCEVRVADDPMLSNPHFRVENGRLTDLGSRFGTTVNGVKVSSAELRNGDVIRAGNSAFAVETAGGGGGPETAVVPAPAGAAEPAAGPPPAGAPAGATAKLLDLLRGQMYPLYAVLDAARDPGILPRVRAGGTDHVSLYDGEKGDELAAFGPWLVRLPPAAAILEELAAAGWGKAWGVYLTSELPAADIRRHLRQFLIVKMPGGRQVYFRYYDPRVLRTYLPTCTPEELATFVGPLRRLIAESPDGAAALDFAGTFKAWRTVELK